MATASERELELRAVEDRNLRVKLALKRINFSSLLSAIFYLIAYFLPRVVASRIITIYYYIAGPQITSLTDQITYTITRHLSELNYPDLELVILFSFVLMLIAAFLEPLVYIVKGPIKYRMKTGFNVTKTRITIIIIALIVNILSAYYLLSFKSWVYAPDHYNFFLNTLETSRVNYLTSTYGGDIAQIIIGISAGSRSYTIISMTVGYYMAIIGRYLAMFAILAILGAMGKEIEI